MPLDSKTSEEFKKKTHFLKTRKIFLIDETTGAKRAIFGTLGSQAQVRVTSTLSINLVLGAKDNC